MNTPRRRRQCVFHMLAIACLLLPQLALAAEQRPQARLKEAAAPENEFFARNGARSGARFVRLSLKYKPGQWVLWLRSPNEMLSECLFQRPGVKNFDSFPMIWRRQPG